MQANIRFENPPHRHSNHENGNIPFLLVALSLVLWFSFQLFQTVKTHRSLTEVYNNQEPKVQTANKIRASLAALASGTKQLANQGNPNAAQIVKALAQRGINISDPKIPPEQANKEAKPEAQPPQPTK